MIRPAAPQDVPQIYRLIRDLAEYEESLDEVTATEGDLRRALFADQPAIFAHVAEHEGSVAGFALWFLNYSTWLGRHGIYLEDLYVSRALLGELARVCLQRGYGRLEWAVLDWNAPARGFYDSLGAAPMDEWTVHRLTGPPLRAVAASVRGPAGGPDIISPSTPY